MSALDLLSWPDLAAAQAEVDRAHDFLGAAESRFRFAPHGMRAKRKTELKMANKAALEAEIRLADLRSKIQ